MKTTINTLFLFVSILLLSCGVGSKRISGTGPIIEDSRMLTTVNEIVLDGTMDVTLRAAEEQSIVVHAQAEVQPVLKTTVKGETLTISTEGNVSMGEGTYIAISIPMLKSVKTLGSGNVRGGGFSGDKLSVSTTAPGDITLDELGYDDYEAKSTGSGNIILAGRGNKLDAETTAPGDINASALTVDKVKATTKGSGDIMLSVGGELKAKITGPGNITYDGSPKIDLEKTGSGELKGN